MDTYPYGIRGERDIDICALSGVKIRPGDIAISIEGTQLFYRIASRHYLDMTPEQQAEIEAGILADAGGVVVPMVDTRNETTIGRALRLKKEADQLPTVGDDNGR